LSTTTTRSSPLLLTGMFLASLALRPQLVGVGPLLSTIAHDLRVSHSVAGLLSTAIVLCMGLFAPAAFVIARRFGQRYTIAAALALVAAFGLARAQAGPAFAVILLTVPVGLGIAVAGSLMPLVVRESWPQRPVLATAIYTTGLSLGAALGAAVAVPLAHGLGSWRDPLTVFSLCTAALMIAWLALTPGHGARVASAPAVPRLPLRNPTAWLLVAIFGLVSITYYGINAWLPASFTERGWSHANAGVLLTIANGVTVPVNVFLAFRGDRFGSRRFWLVLGTVVQLTGLLGVILAPVAGWAWAAMIGAGIGLLLPSMMTMPLDVADHPADVGAMAGLMLGGGYTLAATGPFLLGLLRDAAGSFTLAMWTMFAVTGLILVILLLISHERLLVPAHLARRPAGSRSSPAPSARVDC
jgi:CP family cyanate transporter-like MFS transporter